MKFLRFRIRDFKGAINLELRLDKPSGATVFPLVGLNESGKTTVLEAVNLFGTSDKHLESLYSVGYKASDVHDLVPMRQKDNFNGAIEVGARIGLSDGDKKRIGLYCRNKLGFVVSVDDIPSEYELTRRWEFKDSRFVRSNWDCDAQVEGTSKRGSTKKTLKVFSSAKWTMFLQKHTEWLPRILFFPTFLFEIPTRIDLTPGRDEQPVNAYYRSILQDVLDSLKRDLEIEKHIVDRALSSRTSDERSLESVLTKLGNEITKTVFKKWGEIFGGRSPNQQIEVKTVVEPVVTDHENGEEEFNVFLELRIRDGDSVYLITERSLGFRWYFCFLLFTHFRTARKLDDQVVFLFDEPASNLHALAQQLLLESFQKVTENGTLVLYSTHSHYMINPKWLESTYIVRNLGLSYVDEEDYDYSARDTEIAVDSYRSFASVNPNQTDYFQPILDALDHAPSMLEMGKPALILEGKTDYYVWSYFMWHLGREDLPFRFIPGLGSGHLDALIALHLGWGQRFVVLLDDDSAGRKEMKRYRAEWLLDEETILTLENLRDTWKGFEIEDLISDADQEKLLKAVGLSGKVGKAQRKSAIANALQLALCTESRQKLEAETVTNFRTAFGRLTKRFDDPTNGV